MGDIYENAFLTLSATFAASGEPMFHTSQAGQSGYQPPVMEMEGTPVFARKVLWHPCEPHSTSTDHESSTWKESTLCRAWVFQERALSRRFVHFLKHEIVWECRESTWCECKSAQHAWAHYRENNPRTLENLRWFWDVAQPYSRSSLTYEKDRLPALSGVARRISKLRNKTYLAGLWAEDLVSHLAWLSVDDHSSVRPQNPRPLDPAAPSWSWLSLIGANVPNQFVIPKTDDMNTFHKLFELVDYAVEPPDADHYTFSGMAKLTISGPVIHATMHSEGPGGKYVLSAHNALVHFHPDFKLDPEDPLQFRVVEPGTQVLLLLVRMEKDRKRDSIEGLVLLASHRRTSDEAQRYETRFYERIGSFIGGRQTHLDESGEYANLEPVDDRLAKLYVAGNHMWRGFPNVRDEWFLERAQRRKVTIV